uniref:Uncharacterized protein n=1 Tax=Anopheles culicifacies TaxID=139723 RepID=A0A182MQ19_9DIPT
MHCCNHTLSRWNLGTEGNIHAHTCRQRHATIVYHCLAAYRLDRHGTITRRQLHLPKDDAWVSMLMMCAHRAAELMSVPGTLCEDEDYHPTDEDCWTGSSLSDYTQQVVTTIGNRYNPEVMYNASATVSPHMQTLVDRLINLKTAVNKAYSSNNYRSDVDKMQSDMAEGSGDSYPSDDDEDGDLASGSGDDVSPRTIFRDSSHVTPNFNEISSSKRISASSCWSLLSVSTFVLSLPLLLLNDRFSRH